MSSCLFSLNTPTGKRNKAFHNTAFQYVFTQGQVSYKSNVIRRTNRRGSNKRWRKIYCVKIYIWKLSFLKQQQKWFQKLSSKSITFFFSFRIFLNILISHFYKSDLLWHAFGSSRMRTHLPSSTTRLWPSEGFDEWAIGWEFIVCICLLFSKNKENKEKKIKNSCKYFETPVG